MGATNKVAKKGELKMGFLLSHWHCILPIVGIIVAMFFMRDKKKERPHTSKDIIATSDSQKNIVLGGNHDAE